MSLYRKGVMYHDKDTVCGTCGREFVWTASRQAQRAYNAALGMSRDNLPPFCNWRCANKRPAELRHRP